MNSILPVGDCGDRREKLQQLKRQLHTAQLLRDQLLAAELKRSPLSAFVKRMLLQRGLLRKKAAACKLQSLLRALLLVSKGSYGKEDWDGVLESLSDSEGDDSLSKFGDESSEDEADDFNMQVCCDGSLALCLTAPSPTLLTVGGRADVHEPLPAPHFHGRSAETELSGG